MGCLVCDNQIRIDSLAQLFALEPLRLCGRCLPNLIPANSDNSLFKDNEWIRSVIDRLNRGDLVLVKLFEKRMHSLLRKKLRNYSVEIMNPKKEIPYPWMEVLYQQAVKGTKRENIDPSAEVLFINLETEENTKNQISILEKNLISD